MKTTLVIALTIALFGSTVLADGDMNNGGYQQCTIDCPPPPCTDDCGGDAGARNSESGAGETTDALSMNDFIVGIAEQSFQFFN